MGLRHSDKDCILVTTRCRPLVFQGCIERKTDEEDRFAGECIWCFAAAGYRHAFRRWHTCECGGVELQHRLQLVGARGKCLEGDTQTYRVNVLCQNIFTRDSYYKGGNWVDRGLNVPSTVNGCGAFEQYVGKPWVSTP